MDEYLFIVLAKLKAERLKLEREQAAAQRLQRIRVSGHLVERAVMKREVIAFAASLAVNFALLGAMDWSAYDAQTPPAGEVTVTQLPDAADLAVYAQAAQRGGIKPAAAL